MGQAVRQLSYQRKMDAVFNYIEQHLDEALDLALLAEIACFSKYHFHRQFTSYSGVTPHKYLQLQRLKRASYQLTFNSQLPIIEIALQAGFSNAESFSRTFKKTFEQTPSAFRSQPQWHFWHRQYQYTNHRGLIQMQIHIVQVKPIKIAVLEHRGAVAGLNHSIQKFINWRKRTRLSPIASCATFGLGYDDPAKTPAAQFRFDICGEVAEEVPPNQEQIINKQIPGGRCAQVLHRGSHDQLADKIHYLYAQWLPTSGEELRDFPCFFKYLNFFPEVSEDQLLTEIYLPIK